MKIPFYIFLGILPGFLNAQENPQHFQHRDPAADRISEEDIQRLTQVNWVISDREFHMKGKRVANFNFRLNFNDNGTIFSGKFELGTWIVDRKKLLTIAEKENEPGLVSIQLLGQFAVEWVNEDELILRKVLTSDFENKVIYRLINANRFEQHEIKDLNLIANKGSSTGIKYPLSFSPIRNKVQAEYFMRGMRLPDNFFELSDKELQKLLDELKPKN